MDSTLRTFAASVAEGIAVDGDVNGILQAGLNGAIDRLGERRPALAAMLMPRQPPAFVLTHAAWKLGHGDIAGILRQQPAISCCTMSVEIKLQRAESPAKAQAGGFVASG
ncbi:hypothetical protein [Rhizobium sp. GCM10022189]|uniref:hypothetical protein n=1 Tax=Rhizobium sp. GCM10022189 TaxID=3252654 RepID=UPI00361169B1